VANFAGTPHEGYRVGLPIGGEWEEILNSDDESFGGSGVVNVGPLLAEPVTWNGRPASVELRVPPLGAVWLAPRAR
jgi:1,4-alpha-glucan branching enzyme